MRITILPLFCLFSLVLSAQTIDGRLLDAQAEGLPFATIQVLTADSNLVKYATTREDGSFVISGLSSEAYLLTFSSLGFLPRTLSADLTQGGVSLGDVAMKSNGLQLDEVTVAAERALITVEPDKTVFNVENAINTAGDNGIELLRKAPGLTVDNNDNIIIEGKSGVLVYVNGKQSFLQGDDLNNYLRGLNADEIERIEIITQPSSKYDAAGSAGILNIILKREKGLGLKGSIANTLTYGDYARNNTVVTLNYRQKKFALFGSISHFQGKSTGFFDMYRIQSGNVFDMETRSTSALNNNGANVSADYYLSKRSTISATVNLSVNQSESESNSVTLIGRENSGVVDSVLLAPNRNENATQNIASTLNYTYKGDNGRSLSLDADWVEYGRVSQSLQPNFYTSPNEEVILQENINFQETPIDIRVLSSQVDYEQKLWGGNFSTGVKASQVQTHNEFDFYDVENGENVLNTARSNTFDYTESIGAAYINYAFQKDKWKFQGGLRAEQTWSEGDLKSEVQTVNRLVKRQYLNWFPSGGITYDLKYDNSFALTYSRRIQRPNYNNLNPFESQTNELSFRRGNPFLQPQFTHNIKLSNTYKYTLNTSLTYSYVSDYFAEVSEAEGDRTTFINTRNVADQQTIYFNVSYPREITKWWSVYGSVYGYHSRFTANNPDFIPIARTTYGGYAQSTFTLFKNYKAEVSGWFNSPSIWRGTYRTKSMGALNLAVQRAWENWTVKLSFNDVLYTIPWRAETRFGDLYLTGTGGSDSRNVRLYVNYTFGHNDVKGKKKQKGSADMERGRI